MSDINPCRICLRVGVKMLNYHGGLPLKLYYEEIMGLEVNETDRLPQQFCYECASLLHKFHKFKEKCVYGQHILKDILDKGPITFEALQNASYIPHHIKTVPLIIQSVVCINIESTLDDTYEPAEDFKNVTIACNPIQKFEIEDDYLSEHSISDDLINQEENLFVEEKKVCIAEENITEIKVELIEDEKPIENTIKSTEKTAKSTEKAIKTTEKTAKSTEKAIKTVEKTVKSNGKRKAKLKMEEKVKFKRTSDRRAATSVKYDELLSNDNWDICKLSEEEAWRVFNAKEEDKKYLAAAFKCTDCRKGFSKQTMLDRHLQLKHIESRGRHECPFCHTRYRYECLLKSHMRQHYNKYKCLRCGLECDLRVTAVLHEEYHSGVTRKCLHCNKEFKHLSTYYTHLRTHKSEHVCTLCGESFVSELGLRQHKHVKHVIAEYEIPDDDEILNTYCKLCDIKFETRKAYNEHLFQSALHADDTDNHDQSTVKQPFFDKLAPSRKTLGRRVRKVNTKSTSETGKIDSTEKKIDKRHARRRTNRIVKKPTTCYQCGEHFDTQAACMKHHAEKHPRTSFHSSNERYICEICGSCLAPSSVASHQNIHSKEILHTCNICGRQFSASISLKRHQLTHTGEKPFACSLCDKRFTQSNSMKLHYRTYHLKQPYPKRNRWKKKEEEL